MCRVCAGVCRGQKRISDALELGSQAVMSHLMGILGLNSGSLEDTVRVIPEAVFSDAL